MDKREANALLVKAATNGEVDQALDALEGRADVNVRDNLGSTPLHEAIRFGNTQVATVLINAGANINAPDDYQQTPLHFTAAYGCSEIAKYLIERGADIRARNKHNQTPLEFAIAKGQEDLASLLRSANHNQQLHASRVTGERKDKGPPQVGG